MGPLTLTVTGAAGFVGRACVAEARRRDLPVIAVYRSKPAPEWAEDAGVTPLQVDLTSASAVSALTTSLPKGGALIHAAAHLGDDPTTHLRDTVQTMNTVLHVARVAEQRLIHVSSLAVYDTDQLAPGARLTEGSPLIPLPPGWQTDPGTALAQARDPYAGAKRLQEAFLTHDDHAEDAWILRPGVIWGPGRSWHALMGFWASKLHVTIGSDGELPLCHVDHVAKAAVEAAHRYTEGVSVLNVFDNDRPTRARFLTAHRRCYGWPRANVTVPFAIWMMLARGLTPIAHKLPGLFRRSVLRARMMPLRYPNTRLRSALAGEDLDTFEGMMARTREAEQ